MAKRRRRAAESPPGIRELIELVRRDPHAAALRLHALECWRLEHEGIEEMFKEEIASLRTILVHGERWTFPWFRLKEPRRAQVAKAWRTLSSHPKWAVERACREAFGPAEGGYPNFRALAAYCSSIRIKDYI